MLMHQCWRGIETPPNNVSCLLIVLNWKCRWKKSTKSRKGPPASSPGIGKHVLRGQSGFRAGVPRVENKQTELKSHSKIIPWKYTALSGVLGILSITLSFENTQPHVPWIRVGSVLVCCHILLILHAQWENCHFDRSNPPVWWVESLSWYILISKIPIFHGSNSPFFGVNDPRQKPIPPGKSSGEAVREVYLVLEAVRFTQTRQPWPLGPLVQ